MKQTISLILLFVALWHAPGTFPKIHSTPTPPASFTHFMEYQDMAGIGHYFAQRDFMGGGAAFLDYDRDGDDDLYITSGHNRDHFYENQGDGSFVEMGTEAGFGITDSIYTIGVVSGDIDNDGYRDIFVTTRGSENIDLVRNLLFYNNGNGTFTEIWGQNSFSDQAFSMGAHFMDYDEDGLLDIYVINYVEVQSFIYDENNQIIGYDHQCFENEVYHNLGNGQFEKISGGLGLNDTGCALAVTSSDFDLDGDMDVYIANDFGPFIEPNKLYQNEGSGYMLTEEDYNANIPMYGMGIAIGDIDEDLDLDYYITNFGKNALLINHLTHFEEAAEITGVADTWVEADSTMAVGWGTAFMDIDNDMDLDLYVANGFVPSPDFLPSQLFMNDRLFLNEGGGSFTEVSEAYGISNEHVSRGMAFSDYDNDGDLDVLSVVQNVPIGLGNWETRLFRNETGNEGNWLQVVLEGVEVNRDAIGSKVYVHAGGRSLMREVNGGSSHCSHNSLRLHFGLGGMLSADSLEVIWTGGKRRQVSYDITANQMLQIQEDTTLALITGIEETVVSGEGVLVFPNPSSEHIFIKIPNSEEEDIRKVEVISTQGRVCSGKKWEILEGGLSIHLSGLSSGIYFIKINTSKQAYLKKVILIN